MRVFMYMFVRVCVCACISVYVCACVCVCVVCTALIIAQVLCARSQDSLLSVSVRREHVILSSTGFKGNPCRYVIRPSSNRLAAKTHPACPVGLARIEPKLLAH